MQLNLLSIYGEGIVCTDIVMLSPGGKQYGAEIDPQLLAQCQPLLQNRKESTPMGPH